MVAWEHVPDHPVAVTLKVRSFMTSPESAPVWETVVVMAAEAIEANMKKMHSSTVRDIFMVISAPSPCCLS
jgi:hypothetical protein